MAKASDHPPYLPPARTAADPPTQQELRDHWMPFRSWWIERSAKLKARQADAKSAS